MNNVWIEEFHLPSGGSGEMPMLCSRASVSLRLRSKSESSGVTSVFCWLSDCSACTHTGSLSQHQIIIKSFSANGTWLKTYICTFYPQIPTYRAPIMMLFVSLYLFFLPLLLLSFFLLPDLGEALLLTLQLCFKVTFVRHGVLWPLIRAVNNIWQCYNMFDLSFCYCVLY